MKGKTTLADIVLEILNGGKPEEVKRKYYLTVKAVVAKRVRLYLSAEDINEIEEIAQDITQDFFLWLLREDVKKGFTKRKERLTSGYLLKKINGLIIDYLRKVDTLKKHIPESLDQSLTNSSVQSDNKLSLGEIISDKKSALEEIDWKTTALAFLNTLEKHLKEEQLKTLCHWIFRDKYSADCYLENLSPSAKYKRVERLKKALKEILERNPLDVEEWKAFIELMEIYCQKRFGQCV
jgi:hypothetical protein